MQKHHRVILVILALALVVASSSTFGQDSLNVRKLSSVEGQWGQYKPIHNIAIIGNYAYGTAPNPGGLNVFDISDLSNVQLVHQMPMGSNGADGIATDGTYLYVGAYHDGLNVIDVSDPLSPIIIASLSCGYCSDMKIIGTTLYSAKQGTGLGIFDISDPFYPQTLSITPSSDLVHDVVIQNNYAFMGNGWRGFWVMDISDPINPVNHGDFFDIGGENLTGLDIWDNHLFVADNWNGLHAFNITDPTNPINVDMLPIAREGILNIRIQDGLAYTGGHHDDPLSSNDGLRIIDISDPANMSEWGYYELATSITSIVLHSSIIFVGANDGFFVFEYLGPRHTPAEFHVEISGSANGCLDSNVQAGISDYATYGLDFALDVPKPPAPTQDYIYIYLPHPEWSAVTGDNYMKDIRQVIDLDTESMGYDFVVETDQIGEMTELAFTPSNDFPEECEIYLLDQTQNHYQDLRSDSTYQFIYTSSRRFTLYLGNSTAQKDFNLGWHLMSIPARPETNKLALNDLIMGDTTISFVFKRNSGNYYCLTDSIYYGDAYWMAVVANAPAVSSFNGYPSSSDYEKNLDIGWNLIGDPMTWTIPLSDLIVTDGTTTLTFIDAVDAGWIGTPSVYTLDTWENGTFGYRTSGEIESWFGYWMLVNQSGLTLVTPSTPIYGPNPTAEDFSGTGYYRNADWIVPFSVSNGNWINSLAAFGCADGATSEFDTWFDVPLPPNPASEDYFSISSESSDIEISRDIRPPLQENEVETWNYVINSQEAELILSFRNIEEDLPESYSITLTIAEQEYDLKAVEDIPVYSDGEPIPLSISVTSSALGTNVADNNLPTEFVLQQNYPNPFNPSTTISFSVPMTSSVTLQVFNVEGREVMRLAEGEYQAGNHSVTFDASDMASGVYIYRMTSVGEVSFNASRKMLLIK